MKKIIATAVGLALVGGVAVTTASAVESQFGGYWRTRFYFEENFKEGNNDSIRVTDTRTRLYYTAKFNDDLKFVNKFEFNSSWGDNNGGDIGADGKGNFRIKNSYVDFNLGMVNTKVGIQSATIARGFIFADDMAGIVATADFGMVKVPFLYSTVSAKDANWPNWDGGTGAPINFYTNGSNGPTFGNGNGDVHLVSIMPQIKISDAFSLTPHGTWANVTSQDTYSYYLGLDADLKLDAVTAWFTGIYNGGKVDKIALASTKDADISAYLLAAGADAGIVHGQAFYASGDDNAKDTDINSFVTIGTPGVKGTSYYWSEILGEGVFDNVVAGTPGDHLSNIWAANLGVTVKPMDKLKLDFDAWYAQYAEDVLVKKTGKYEKDLGLELDGKLTYELLDNLNAEFVLAYLFAGDAIGDNDIVEGGVQLSLKF